MNATVIWSVIAELSVVSVSATSAISDSTGASLAPVIVTSNGREPLPPAPSSTVMS